MLELFETTTTEANIATIAAVITAVALIATYINIKTNENHNSQ